MIFARSDHFHRVGTVTRLKILKNQVRVPTKRNGPFLRHYSAVMPHKMPYSYCRRSLCLRCHCEFPQTLRDYRIGFGARAHLQRVAFTKLEYPGPPQAMVACPHVLGPSVVWSGVVWCGVV